MKNPIKVYKLVRDIDGRFFSVMPLQPWAETEYEIGKVTMPKDDLAKRGYYIVAFKHEAKIEKIYDWLNGVWAKKYCNNFALLLCETKGLIEEDLPPMSGTALRGCDYGFPIRSFDEFLKALKHAYEQWPNNTVMCKSIKPIRVLRRYNFGGEK